LLYTALFHLFYFGYATGHIAAGCRNRLSSELRVTASVRRRCRSARYWHKIRSRVFICLLCNMFCYFYSS